MDLRMPVLDGLEVTKKIRNEELRMKNSRSRTIIIAITANSFEDNRAEMPAIGGDDFIGKPFRAAEIFETITKHLDIQYVYQE